MITTKEYKLIRSICVGYIVDILQDDFINNVDMPAVHELLDIIPKIDLEIRKQIG